MNNTAIKATEIYELTPNNGRSSFYGKAKVIVCGNERYLRSYDTICCKIDENGNIHRYSDYKTNTTCCHIKSFLGDCRYNGYWNLPIEGKPRITVEI